MSDTSFSLIDGNQVHAVEARLEAGGVRVSPESLREALGWTLAPEGLCRGEECVPVLDPAALADERGIDLAGFAALLDRPLAVDTDECAAALGSSAAERSRQLDSLEAPDFTLPDLAGRPHSLSEQRGKKVLLIAYASW